MRQPNVLVIVVDDMGFGAPSAYGGPCLTPVAERLADHGLRYTRFHVTALCSPTRQSLMTGRNHHAVGMGSTTEMATGVAGNTSVRPDSAATLAQVLKLNGYRTGAFGKWHQTPQWECGPDGPFDRWPTGEGFDHFYGFLNCEMNHWDPHLYEGTTPLEHAPRPGYHLSEDLVDQAIAWLRDELEVHPDEPFFLYLPFGACHAPLHVPRPWRDRYAGRFAHGWNRQREITLARQKELGLVPSHAELPPWPDDVPLWEDLSAADRTIAEAFMETYAGFAEHMDAQVGRLVDVMDELGVLDSTLTMYLLGDNGSSAEGGVGGTLNIERSYSGITDSTDYLLEHLDELGGPEHLPHHPVGWTLALNTPYRWTKGVASHFGGTRNGMVVHWPDGIAARGEVRHQWHHVNDVYSTVLEVAGITVPTSVNGVEQQPLDGSSMAYTFADAGAEDRRTTQYFETVGNRAIYHDGWIAAAKHRAPWEPPRAPDSFDEDPWELYDLVSDWTEAHDLAPQQPAKVAELRAVFEAEATRNHVFPLDHRYDERANPALAGRPDAMHGRTSLTLRPGDEHLPEERVLNLKNRSHRVSATVELQACADGVLTHQGGRFAGWTLYLDSGRLTYGYNYYGLETHLIQAPEPTPAGPHTLGFTFEYDGGGLGAGASVHLDVDGQVVAHGVIPQTVAYSFSYHETLDVGVDHGTPVVRYPWADTRFTSRLHELTISLSDTEVTDEEARGRAMRALNGQ